MLFNLSSQRHFPNSQKGYAIGCYSSYGPIFAGGSAAELTAFEPFNEDGRCISDENKVGYNIRIEDGKNTLTNQKDGFFTITELEVWEVKFIVTLNL